MDDKDGDRFYDIGEGLGRPHGHRRQHDGREHQYTTSQSAGGYSLALAAGTYTVTFSGGGYSPVTKR